MTSIEHHNGHREDEEEDHANDNGQDAVEALSRGRRLSAIEKLPVEVRP